MSMIFIMSLIGIIFIIYSSIRLLFTPGKIKDKHISFDNFLFLASIYATVMLGFGLMYFLLEMNGFQVLDDGTARSGNIIERLETFFYFSAVTLFSVGYGEIAPIGFGRIIAVSEALIGYTIPAAFVYRTVIDLDRR